MPNCRFYRLLLMLQLLLWPSELLMAVAFAAGSPVTADLPVLTGETRDSYRTQRRVCHLDSPLGTLLAIRLVALCSDLRDNRTCATCWDRVPLRVPHELYIAPTDRYHGGNSTAAVIVHAFAYFGDRDVV